MGDGRGDCLVVTVLFCRGCGGDSFEEDLRKGRSLPDLLDVILSASAWVILLNSGSSLKSPIVTSVDTPLNTKIFPFVASA